MKLIIELLISSEYNMHGYKWELVIKFMLYVLQKKSREESKGAGSGVEILVNEPYDDGPGGHGQYTHKIYHVGSHLPGN